MENKSYTSGPAEAAIKTLLKQLTNEYQKRKKTTFSNANSCQMFAKFAIENSV